MDKQVNEIVKKIVHIPHDFNHRKNLSELTLLHESGYLELYDKIQEVEIAEVLKLHPHLIDEWLQWSDDNRSSEKWYFTRGDDGKCFVAHWPEGKEFEEISTTDEFRACAAFIKREVEEIRKLSE